MTDRVFAGINRLRRNRSVESIRLFRLFIVQRDDAVGELGGVDGVTLFKARDTMRGQGILHRIVRTSTYK